MPEAAAQKAVVQVTTLGTGWGTASCVFYINAIGETVNISNLTVKGGDISGLAGDDANYNHTLHILVKSLKNI